MAFSKIAASSLIDGIVSDRPNATPLIINSNMAVAQRGTSASGLGASASYNTCDRWKLETEGSPSARFTQSQDTDVPTGEGFSSSLKMDCTTSATPDADDGLAITYRIESQDLQLLKYGTSSAEKITLSFWVKATKTGTNVIWIYQNDDSRSQAQSYTVNTTNTWEKKTVVFNADTTGVIDNNTGEGFRITWWLTAGSNFTSGTLATTWQSHTSANNAVGQVNNADNTSNNFWITGVQMEVGEYTSSTIPPFQHESFGDNLFRCQRYYNIFGNATGKPIGMAAFYTASAAYCGPLVYPVEMRSSPTISITGGSGDAEATAGYAINHSAQNDWFQTFSSSATSTKECHVYVSSGVSATDGDAGRCKTGDSSANVGKIEASAEL